MKSPRPTTLFLICAVPALLAVTSGAGPQTSLKHRPVASTAAAGNSDHQKTTTGQHSSLGSPIIFVQTPELAEGDLRARFPQGSHIARLDAGAEAASPINLTPEFYAAADPQISFDATKVLFAAQERSASRWEIWEMNVDGSSKRRVTSNQSDCLRPAYLAHESLTFTVVREDAGRAASEVHVAKLDGTEDHAITFGPGNYQVEAVLKDGRILLSAASPLVRKGANSTALYVIRHDGTGMQSLRCEHAKPAVRREATELADGSVVFVKNAVAKGQAGGELAMIRRGALHNSTFSPLAPPSLSPRPLSESKLIVSRRTGAAAKATSKFDLYTVESDSGRLDKIIYKDPKLSSVQAVPVAAHATPRWYWSTLNPEAKSGYFICLDAYHSVDEPTGRIAASITKVRVLTLDVASGQERSLGEAPVEKDGSFYVAVPPDKPMRFELLDEKGAIIRIQQSWIWSRRGEERGCVGCHEDKSVAPENRWPLTLRRFDTPTPLGSEVDVKVER
jgi:hypothetical protein